MVAEKVIVTNKSGIHARPAGVLAKVAMRCNSEVTLVVGERRVNPKSVLNLMAAAIRCGTEIGFECHGQGEAEDLQMLIGAVKSGLGEDTVS